MDYILYYKIIRTSHNQMYDKLIKAKSAMLAFIQAVKIMKDNELKPDDFDSFYISPIKINWEKPYTMQLHGWDREGDFPRERYNL